ncbi:MAG: hypothetical protein JWQ19_3887, partial [Subtercola sp.]|nr:hypothetical protein [Subtercola sp.]
FLSGHDNLVIVGDARTLGGALLLSWLAREWKALSDNRRTVSETQLLEAMREAQTETS